MNQNELPLKHFPFQPYLAQLKRRRQNLALSNFVPPWKQLRLPLSIKNLVRIGKSFIWTRTDGRQFFCKTKRQLVARIKDWDGFILRTIFKGNGRLIKT